MFFIQNALRTIDCSEADFLSVSSIRWTVFLSTYRNFFGVQQHDVYIPSATATTSTKLYDDARLVVYSLIRVSVIEWLERVRECM